MTPFMGVRISWLTLARKLLLARLAASAASLASRVACSASLRSVMSCVEPARRSGVPSGGAIGLGARAHPFVVAGLVPQREIPHRRRCGAADDSRWQALETLRVVGMHQLLKALAGDAQLADAVAQHFLEAQAEPGDVGDEVDFPQAVLGAAHRARSKRLSMESKAASVRFKSLMSTMAPVMRTTSPDLSRDTVAFSPIQRSPPPSSMHAVFAAIGGIFRGGVDGRAAHAGDIVGMHPRQQAGPDRRAWSRAGCRAARGNYRSRCGCCGRN